jgi:hypothetical protein
LVIAFPFSPQTRSGRAADRHDVFKTVADLAGNELGMHRDRKGVGGLRNEFGLALVEPSLERGGT